MHYTGRRAALFVIIALSATGLERANALTPSCAHNDDWSRLVVAHVTRYPKMQPEDVYKLLHQATMGSEHAAPGRAEAESWLTSELQTMGAGPPEPVLDTLGHNGRVVRVNLRPFVAAHGSTSTLLEDFLKTASQVKPDTSELRCALNVAIALSESKSIPFNASTMRALVATQAAAGFAATHHSAVYEAAYKPAYRVISRELAAQLVNTEQPKREL